MPTESLDAPLKDPRRHRYEGPSFIEVENGAKDECELCGQSHDKHPPEKWFEWFDKSADGGQGGA